MAGTNVVVVDRGNNTTCSINLLGATIVSWRVNNVEQLCVSDKTRFDQRTEIVGGIEIIFPHFGYWKFGPTHGFARLVRWNLEKAPNKIASGDVEVIFSLRDNEYTKSIWNFAFLITYRLILREKELRTYVKIKNTSSRIRFPCDFLLRNYLKVPNIDEHQIIGLYRSTYSDRLLSNCDEQYKETSKFLTFEKEIDRIYSSNTHEILLADYGGKEYLEVWKENFPNVLIWKPFKKMENECYCYNDGDFNDDDYLTMLCIGVGYISNRENLRPGCTIEANEVIKLII